MFAKTDIIRRQQEGVVRKGLHALQDKYGSFPVRGVGITGSGRELLGARGRHRL